LCFLTVPAVALPRVPLRPRPLPGRLLLRRAAAAGPARRRRDGAVAARVVAGDGARRAGGHLQGQ